MADVESGAVPESVIDEHVCRLLRLAERVRALGGPGEQRVARLGHCAGRSRAPRPPPLARTAWWSWPTAASCR